MLRLPNFNMLFQLVLRNLFKSELFSCLPKVDHVIKSCKEPMVTNINFLLTIPIHTYKSKEKVVRIDKTITKEKLP